jgi:uncharacterized protein YdcH (DUF465 family)
MTVDSQLLQSDEEYRQLAERHQEMEARLTELTAKHYLSEQEQVEEVTLKKRKLQIKDHMAAIVRRAQSGAPPSLSHAAPAPPRA